MARRTKQELEVWREEKRKIRNNERIDKLIQENKYLADSKYYKNNYWSWAAWDSWAARGQAGSCGCGCGYYNASLNNTRHTTAKGGKQTWIKGQVIEKLCYHCAKLIEQKLNIKFKSR